MIKLSKCCKQPYRLEWLGLRVFAICSYCKKRVKEIGYFVLYDEDIIYDGKRNTDKEKH